MNKKISVLGIVILIIVVSVVATLFMNSKEDMATVTNFVECEKAGFPIQEKYPRVCVDAKGNSHEEILNIQAKIDDLIKLESPAASSTVKSPIEIKGTARGYWYFEGSFPVAVADNTGFIIGEGIATASGEWMTENFVPFTASISYTPQPGNTNKNGTLILEKDNPSGLPENAGSLKVPIMFE